MTSKKLGLAPSRGPTRVLESNLSPEFPCGTGPCVLKPTSHFVAWPLEEFSAMFQRAALASLFLGVALAGPASAQINLRWKFQEGDIFWIEEKITAKTDITAN